MSTADDKRAKAREYLLADIDDAATALRSALELLPETGIRDPRVRAALRTAQQQITTAGRTLADLANPQEDRL